MNGNRSNSFGKKRKPWHVQAAIEDLHKQMKTRIGEWLDSYISKVCPEQLLPHLRSHDKVYSDWLKSEGYHYDHKTIRHISDFSFAMEFTLYKGEASDTTIQNKFDFIVNHDGGFKEPHAIAAMIFTGQTPSNL